MPYGSDPFSSPGNWLKGNLHTHSTQSDGDLAPDAVVNWYADRGYDFLAITDHRIRTIVDPPAGDRLTLIPSMEFDLWEEVTGFEFHVLGIGIKSIDESLRGESLRNTVGEIKNDGGLSILAHPYWHGLTTDVVLNCDGLDGMEVFNSTCEDMNGKGNPATSGTPCSTAEWTCLDSRWTMPTGDEMTPARLGSWHGPMTTVSTPSSTL